MTIPEPVKATILAFAERFPLPSRDGGDEARRTWTMNLVSHLAFKFGQKWGSKSGDSGRPISKDSIAYQGDVLYGFDIVDGATMQLKWPNGMDLTNKTAENEFTAPQHFWAAGETDRQGHTIPPARDWLGTEPIPEPEPGPGETPIPNEPIPGGVAEILTTMLREQREFYAYLRARLK